MGMFKKLYESLGIGDVVFVKNDPTEYIIKGVEDGKYELVDAKTKKKTKFVDAKTLHATQQDLFGGKASTEAPKKKSYKRVKKMGKEPDIEQLSLF